MLVISAVARFVGLIQHCFRWDLVHRPFRRHRSYLLLRGLVALFLWLGRFLCALGFFQLVLLQVVLVLLIRDILFQQQFLGVEIFRHAFQILPLEQIFIWLRGLGLFLWLRNRLGAGLSDRGRVLVHWGCPWFRRENYSASVELFLRYDLSLLFCVERLPDNNHFLPVCLRILHLQVLVHKV